MNKRIPSRRRKSKPAADLEFMTNYDKYLYLMEGFRKDVYSNFFKDKAMGKKNISRAKKALKGGFLDDNTKETAEGIVKAGNWDIENAVGSVTRIEDSLRDSHLFMMGPATSESLFYFKPSDYDFIEKGRLPFDNCYFELVDSLDVKLPGLDLEASLEGVHVHHKGLVDVDDIFAKLGISEDQIDMDNPALYDDHRNYDITAFMNIEKHGVGIFKMGFEVLDSKMFNNAELHLPGLNGRMLYHGPWISKKAVEKRKGKLEKMDFEVTDSVYTHEASPFGRVLRDGPDTPKDFRDVDCKDASKFVESLYGFSVNMINYVNAHNVTVVKRDSNGPPQGKDRNPHSKPYNIITLKDEVKYVGESEEGAGEELKYRIYVRGHPRRYRDEDRVIRKVSWVTPHVRGPENAPWKEQRYQVLAAKLLREKAFNKMMDEKGYDGLKDF